MKYTSIAIIYNPNSTGPSEALARELEGQIRDRMPRQKVELIATKHAGHATELAYDLSRSSKRPLIISSSGDGGYHEVVNGAIKAQNEGAHPTTGLLPAGNANDHYRNLHRADTVNRIAKGTSRNIDLLKLVGTSGGKRFERYAHSYIGFGLTPIVGNELNKTKLNPIKETWIVILSLFRLKPVRLQIRGKTRRYESIIFSNVDEMSKYLKISKPSSMTDGKFEVTIFRRRNKLRLIKTLLRATIAPITQIERVSEYELRTIRNTLVQADGEIASLDAGTKVTITCERQMLASIV